MATSVFASAWLIAFAINPNVYTLLVELMPSADDVYQLNVLMVAFCLFCDINAATQSWGTHKVKKVK